MKTNEQTVKDLIERKKAYDIRRAARKKRLTYLSAALAIILIVSSIPVIAFTAANKAKPEAPEVTEEPDTFGATKALSETEEITETETERITVEQTESNDITTANQEISQTEKPQEFIIQTDFDFDNADKENMLALTKEYGSKNWLNWQTLSDYGLVSSYSIDPDNSDEVFYGKNPDNGIYSVIITITLNKGLIDKIGPEGFLYIETEGNSEIVSGNSAEYTSDDYEFVSNEPNALNDWYSRYKITFHISLRLNGDNKYTVCKCYLISSETAAEYGINEYLAAGNRLEDHSLFNNHYKPISFCLVEIHGFGFLKDAFYKAYDIRTIYERASVYFGDVDENGVPLFITDPDLPDYQHPHGKIDRSREDDIVVSPASTADEAT